jgi:mannose-6-phosphate isomerase-like protein (cupin superfamily)
MEIRAFSTNGVPERKTVEGCYIREISNSELDQEVSIARARVEPGVTTTRHRIRGTIERYLILEGEGLVEVGDHFTARVSAGDVVWIPRDTTQRISNTGTSDLIFLCICNPRFKPECYEATEEGRP